MIEHLQKLGLTEIESRCYLALYEKPNQTGYAIAKTLGISRSNVYASLQSLETKGGCISSGDTKTTYTAVPVKDFLNILRMDFRKSSRYLRKELSKMTQAPFEIRSVQGEEKLINMITRILMSAENKIIIEASKEAYEKLNPILQEIDIPIDKHSSDHITIMVDEKSVFMGSLEEGTIPSGLLTFHPSMVAYFKESFENKGLIQKIIKDQGQDFLNQYK